MTNRFIRISPAIVIVFVYLFALGSFPLVGPDEPRYSQVAREMFERGDWVTPTLGGANWFEKPVLLYWLQIVFYHLFGVGEFAARLGSALFGLGTIFSLWMMGKRSAVSRRRSAEKRPSNDDQRSTSDERRTTNDDPPGEFAYWLALIAASSTGLLVFSRGASFDIILTFPITAALVCYFLFDTRLRERNPVLIPAGEKTRVVGAFPIRSDYLFLAGFYFFIGLALLAKGLVGIVFPMAIVFFYHLLKRELLPSRTFLLSLVWGTILSLAVASFWYLPMYHRHGWSFVDEFFVQHHFQRFTSDKYQHRQPFWFFWLVLPAMTLPWLPFFLHSIWSFIKGTFQPKDAEKIEKKTEKKFSLLTSHFSLETSPLLLFSFSWLIVPLIFFSFSGSKLPGYILPALPAALVLTADSVFRFARKKAGRRRLVRATAFVTFAVVALLLLFVVPRFADSDSVKNLIRQADEKNHRAEKIVNLFVVSHNAEFYAAGRIVRETDGKAKRYDNFQFLVEDAKREKDGKILVLVPSGSRHHVTESPAVDAEIVADNGDTALILVRSK